MWVWAIIASAAGLGMWLFRRDPARPVLERLPVALIPMALVALGTGALIAFADVAYFQFNAPRLSASLALVRGFDLYVGPGEGPILDFVYGPGAALAYVPAVLLGSPTAALTAAGVLSLLFYFAPMAWLHTRAAGGSGPWAALAFLAFALLTFLDTGLTWAATLIHADAPSVGLAASACALLTYRHGRAPRLALALAAVCVTLSAATKQMAVPLFAALPLYLWVVDGFRTGFRFGLYLLGAGLAIAGIAVAFFGLGDMLFNMVQLPSTQPWKDEAGAGRLLVALGSLWMLVWHSALPVAPLLGLLLWVGPSRLDWRGSPWFLSLLVALLMVPVSVVGFAKVGGDLNQQAYTLYFLAAASTLALAGAGTRLGPTPAVAGTAALVLLVGIFSATLEVRAGRLDEALQRYHSWTDNPEERAIAFARRNPDVYFPFDPFVALVAHGRLYHSCWGIWSQELSGQFAQSTLESHLPAPMHLVAVRTLHEVPRFLAAYDRRVAVEGLADWNVYARRAASP